MPLSRRRVKAIGWHKESRHRRHIDDHFRLPQ
jgi:hypothetical protein